jgi:tripartite-type tricarboxylate transporter receptor subunit TctC
VVAIVGMRTYAVTAKARLDSAPDIPTVEEAGLPGLQMSVWNAIWVPKRTPKDVIAKLNASAVEALADPDLRHHLSERGLDIPPREEQTPEALGAFHKAEIEKWRPLIKAANSEAK